MTLPPRLLNGSPTFRQWISAERFSASFSFSSVKSGLRAISRIGVSRRPQSSQASGIFAAISMRDHDRAMLVGVDQIVGANRHAGDAHFAAEILGMHPGMRRTDRAGQRLEARRPLRDVADRAVGDDAEAAERLVHVALHLTPERAIADVGAVDILDHGDARAEAGADIFVIGDAALGLLVGRKAGFQHRADRHGAGIADHRRQIGKRADQRLGRVADQPALGRHDFHRIADRRRVVARQRFEDGSGQRGGAALVTAFLS